MSKTTDFDRLVGNGFDFLNKSMKEFDTDPKFSVIHFYTALELFLKARLLVEHWTLILTKPESGHLGKFKVGDFQSINLKDAHLRLIDIVQDGLTPDEYKCFDELRNHRNRMVHFFHTAMTAKKSEMENIVSQQCRGWYYLHGLLSQRWLKVFNKHQMTVASCNKVMHKHGQFLRARFDFLKPDIVIKKSAGSHFHKCPACGFRSFEEITIHAPALEYSCMVCNFSSRGIAVNCPKCAKAQHLIGEAGQPCTGCGHFILAEEIAKQLPTCGPTSKHDMYDAFEASCGNCLNHLSVVSLKDGVWLCTSCFARYDDSDINQCEACGDYTTEDIDDSQFRGCEHCDGMYIPDD